MTTWQETLSTDVRDLRKENSARFKELFALLRKSDDRQTQTEKDVLMSAGDIVALSKASVRHENRYDENLVEHRRMDAATEKIQKSWALKVAWGKGYLAALVLAASAAASVIAVVLPILIEKVF